MKIEALALPIVTTLVFSFLFCGLIVQPVDSQSFETIYIRADGSIEGTDKIQRVEDVYTFTANVYGSIVVEKDNIIVEGDDYTLHGTGTGNGTALLGRKNVEVKNLKIIQFATGIYIYDYSNSGNNTITGNNIASCGYGLYMDGSHNNTITGNNLNNNDCGVFILASHFNIFKNNQLLDNQRNLSIHGGYLAAFTQYMDTSNTMNSKPIYYWIEEQEKTVPPDAGFVALVECENIKVQNLKLTSNGQSILLFSTQNSVITRNTVKTSEVGIFVSDSQNITICENIIDNNDIGIGLDGKYPVYSQNNTIFENSMTNNDVGIQIWESSNNTIYRNHIADNGCGIRINRLGGEAETNCIYHNNFVNSTVDVPGYWHTVVFREVWVPPPENVWDYSNEGNYWSDYKVKYPNATEIDVSGTWNTPYVISENNQDNYPLIDPVETPDFPEEKDESEPFPTTLVAVASIATVVVVGVGLLVYFKKRKH
jgi:parallel beta-helix repeat protein